MVLTTTTTPRTTLSRALRSDRGLATNLSPSGCSVAAMVRDMYQREYNRPPQWTDTRFPGMEPGYGDDPRYHDAPVTTIGAALRERCKIPAEKYFVAAILDNGRLVCYGGPDEWHKREMTSFFDPQQFELAAKRHCPPGRSNHPCPPGL